MVTQKGLRLVKVNRFLQKDLRTLATKVELLKKQIADKDAEKKTIADLVKSNENLVQRTSLLKGEYINLLSQLD